MEIKDRKSGIYRVIEIAGQLDTTNYSELESNIFSFIDKGENFFVLDCSGLTYISSSGLRVMLMALKKLKASDGKFHLCSLKENILEIFEIAGFTSIFTIFPDIEQAVR